jgi:hypothetical protein
MGGSCSTTKTSVGAIPQLTEVADQRLAQATLGLTGAAGEHRDLDQDEVVATAGWQLEVLASIFNDALHPVVFRDTQSLTIVAAGRHDGVPIFV